MLDNIDSSKNIENIFLEKGIYKSDTEISNLEFDNTNYIFLINNKSFKILENNYYTIKINNINNLKIKKKENFIGFKNGVISTLNLELICLLLIIIIPVICLFAYFEKKNVNDNKLIKKGENLLLLSFLFSIISVPFSVFLYTGLIFFIIGLIKHKRFNFKKENIIFVLFLFCLLISGLLANYKGMGISGFIIFTVYFVIYQSSKYLSFSSFFKNKIPIFLSLSLIIWGLFSLIQYYNKFDINIIFNSKILYTIVSEHWDHRIISFFQYHSLGGYIVNFILLLIIYNFIINYKNYNLINKFIIISGILIGGLLLWTIQSRGAVIFFIINLLTLLTSIIIKKIIQTKFKIKYFFFLILIISSTLIILINLNPRIYSSLNNIFNSKNNISQNLYLKLITNLSGQGREDQLKYAFDLMKEFNPIFGIGPINFRSTMLKKGIDPLVDFIHPAYVNYIVETGVFGFITLYLFFILSLLNKFIDFFKTKNINYIFSIGYILAYLIISLFDNIFYNVLLGVLFWFSFGFFSREDITLDIKLNNLLEFFKRIEIKKKIIISILIFLCLIIIIIPDSLKIDAIELNLDKNSSNSHWILYYNTNTNVWDNHTSFIKINENSYIANTRNIRFKDFLIGPSGWNNYVYYMNYIKINYNIFNLLKLSYIFYPYQILKRFQFFSWGDNKIIYYKDKNYLILKTINNSGISLYFYQDIFNYITLKVIGYKLIFGIILIVIIYLLLIRNTI